MPKNSLHPQPLGHLELHDQVTVCAALRCSLVLDSSAPSTVGLRVTAILGYLAAVTLVRTATAWP